MSDEEKELKILIEQYLVKMRSEHEAFMRKMYPRLALLIVMVLAAIYFDVHFK